MAGRPHNTALIHSPELDSLSYPDSIPFNTSRAGKAVAALDRMGLLDGPDRAVVAPEPAPLDRIERFHTRRYLDALRRGAQGEHNLDFLAMGIGTPDCPVFPEMFSYPRLACGATLKAAELLASGEAGIAFNPSGGYHHADPERAAGFCYINDVAIGSLALIEQVDRLMVIDVDVHHGDGVERAFYSRSDVMTVSFHESGRFLFPGTGFEDDIGEGEGRGYAVNVPLPPGTYDEIYVRAFDAVAVPLIRAYRPDVIVLEVGMDALSGDPLAHLSLTNNAYCSVIRRVMAADRPLLVTGGGGYHVENTARGWALAWAVLCGADEDEGSQAGLGGVMIETTDWTGGLRDRRLPPTDRQRRTVDPKVDATIRKVRANVFPYHNVDETDEA